MEDVSFLYQDTTDEVVPTSSTTYSTSYMPSNEPSVSIEMISGNSNVPTWSPTLYKECVGEEELHRLVLYNVTKGAELIVMNGEEAVFEMDFGEGGAVNVTNATTSNSSSNSSIEYLCLETTKCYTANANGVDWELHKILTPDTGTLLVVAGGGDDYKSCHFGDCVTSCYGKIFLCSLCPFQLKIISIKSHIIPFFKDKDGHLKEETTPSPSDTPTQQPTPSPTWKRTRRPTTPAPSVYLPQDAVTFGSERYQRLLNILLTASPDSEEALISDTPQRTALIWLYNSVMKLSNKRIVSRWILASFYYALNGDDWFNNRGWLSANNDECDWYGITCSEGKVTRIEMEENRCVGVLIPEIALWKDSLYYLSLGNNYDTPAEERNEIVMPLPEFLRELHLLSYLNLEGVGLSSIIPKNLFSNWNRLESLYLNDNDITGTLPSGITNLKTIRTLWMGGNNLGGSIISEIGQLTTLVDLSLESNFRENASGKRGFMASLPASLGQLTKLEVLDLSDNALSGTIPLQLGNLISLRSLDLSNNFFESQLPSVLGKLQMLEDLDISWNWCVIEVGCVYICTCHDQPYLVFVIHRSP